MVSLCTRIVKRGLSPGKEEASQTGAPFMRALVYEFQDDPAVYDESFDYMFGRSILVEM